MEPIEVRCTEYGQELLFKLYSPSVSDTRVEIPCRFCTRMARKDGTAHYVLHIVNTQGHLVEDIFEM